MLRIDVLRAATESTAQAGGRCAICGTTFELGAIFLWMNIDGGPDELCERCLRGLCEWANSEGLDVSWKDAHNIYQDARRRYTEPMATNAEMEAMSLDEQSQVFREAYLTC